MTKLFRFAAVAVLSFALFAQAGLSGEKYKIGYFSSNFNDIFQIYIVDAVKEYAAGRPEISLEVMDAQEDVIRQQDQVATLVQSGVDALIVVPVDTSSVASIVELAHEKKIPLIFVNRNPYPDSTPPDGVYFIGANSILEGEAQLNFVGEKLGGKGNIVILMGILSNEAAVNRTQGNHNVINRKYPGMKVLAEETGNWQQDQGMNVMENWITAYGDRINAVVSNNDNMALGAVQALRDAGMNEVAVVGIDATTDALEAIRDGKMLGTVLQDPVAQGAGSVEMALKLLKGEKVEQVNKLPAELVTRDNVAEYIKKKF